MKTVAVSFLLLALATGSALAQTAPRDEARDATAAATPDAGKAPDVIDRFCLRETGTMIRSRRAGTAMRERCPSHQFGRVYTQDDLRSTGQVDIAQALRMLDPSIR